MAYKFTRGASGPVRAFSIPPSIDPKIKEHPLTDLKMAFAEAWDSAAMEKYVAALTSASLEEIELARPQIYFTLNNVLQRLTDQASYTRLSDVEPIVLIGDMFESVVKEINKMLVECDKEPRNRQKLRWLAGSLGYLAELREFCSVIATSIDSSFAVLEEKATSALTDALDKIKKFRLETASRYPDVGAILPPSGEVEAKAVKAIAEADFNLPRLSKRDFERTLGIIGDHGDLWAAADGKARQKLIEMGRLQPLSQRDGKDIVIGVSRLMNDFDRIFNRKGFIADLRCLAVANRFVSINKSNIALGQTEGAIRRSRKYLYESKEDHQKRIDEAVKRLPADRLRDQLSASQWQSSANTISELLHKVERATKGENSTAFVNFRLEGGVLIGEMDVPGSDAIVIYDDTIVRGSANHPEAVWAVRMPTSALANGVPPLEAVREMMSSQATNYHSLVECLTELDGEIERNYFFGGNRISGHNAFEVLDGRINLSLEDVPSPSIGYPSFEVEPRF